MWVPHSGQLQMCGFSISLWGLGWGFGEEGLERGAMGIHMVVTNFKGEELFSSHILGTEENGCC